MDHAVGRERMGRREALAAVPDVDVICRRHVRVTCDGQTDLIGFGPGEEDTVDHLAIERGQ